jgi:hypothetical protein
MKLHISGTTLGRKVRSPEADVVHIQQAIPSGPAENAFVLVCHSGRARYISWIGYYDIEYARERELDGWLIVEPPRAFERDVDWFPYGWDGANSVPTIGDSVLDKP